MVEKELNPRSLYPKTHKHVIQVGLLFRLLVPTFLAPLHRLINPATFSFKVANVNFRLCFLICWVGFIPGSSLLRGRLAKQELRRHGVRGRQPSQHHQPEARVTDPSEDQGASVYC